MQDFKKLYSDLENKSSKMSEAEETAAAKEIDEAYGKLTPDEQKLVDSGKLFGKNIALDKNKSLRDAETHADTNADTITVSNAQDLINAIKTGTATTIKVDKDINLGTIVDNEYKYIPNINKRDFTIESATPGTKHTIDFSGYCFNMSSQNTVTFKDLNIYSRTYWGAVYNAGGYVFDNIDFTGSQLVYTKPSINSTVTFKNTVNATTVGSYNGPLDGKARSSQGGNNQQILQFEGGNNKIIFGEGSHVTLTTANSDVLEIDKGNTDIDVKNGAIVSLNPHSKNGPENLNGMNPGIARAIASKGTTNLTIDKGGTLNINLKKASDDKDLSGALFLNSGATINVNGNLNIDSDGIPSTSRNDYSPVYINGTAAINVDGGSFKLNATNMGDDYTDSIIKSNGSSTISIKHQGTFEVTGDGTKANAVQLGNGSTFTSDQPGLFDITMPEGATAIKGGKVQFTRVKTSQSGQPIGEIDITYADDGTPTVTKVTSHDKQTVIDTKKAGDKAKNKINLIKAGEDVDLTSAILTKDADGNYIMSGTATPGSYVTVKLGNKVLKSSGSQTVYTITNESNEPIETQDPYTVQVGTDGKWTVNLGHLGDSGTLSAQASKDFVESDADSQYAKGQSIADWLKESGDALTQTKTDANNAIDHAAQEKKDAIKAAKDAGTITDAQATDLNNQVDGDVTAAKNAVKSATTTDAVKDAQTKGVNKINGIEVPTTTTNITPDITDNTSSDSNSTVSTTTSDNTVSTPTTSSEEDTIKLVLTHNAYVYNQDMGITYKDNKPVVLKKGTPVTILDKGKKHLIKGKEFYRIGDNQYIKVSNTISYYRLVHNSFLYNKHGKAIKRHGKRVLVRKGVRFDANKVKLVKINGKKFYKVGETYIKFRNIELVTSPNK